MEMRGQFHAPTALPPRKLLRYPFFGGCLVREDKRTSIYIFPSFPTTFYFFATDDALEKSGGHVCFSLKMDILNKPSLCAPS
jgi:hypothetical protein